MSDLSLYADLAARKLVTADGGQISSLPAFVLGDTARVELKTLRRNAGGDFAEEHLKVRTLHASIGLVLVPPVSGTFKLKIEDPGAPGTFYTSAAIAFDADAATLAAALTGMLATLTWVVSGTDKPAPSTWLFKISVGAPALLVIAENKLAPLSFVRIRTFQIAGDWWHELRLVQCPPVWNEDGHERVLPPAPSVARVYAGDPGDEVDPPRNELQDMTVAANFLGTYFLRWNSRRSSTLNNLSGADDIAAALNAMFTDGAERFAVTIPADEHAYIEFIGDLAGTPQNLITVEVQAFPPGVLTFLLSIDRAEMHALLRVAETVTLFLEIELEIVNEDQDPDDVSIAGRFFTLCQQSVTVVREQIFRELATVQAIDWQHPPTPKSYIPFSPTQRIVGDHHFTLTVGDGAATEFDLPHNLATGWLRVTVIDMLTGRQVADTEYTVIHESANDSAITFGEAPALNQFGVIVSAAGPIDTFIADLLVEIEQVTGLQAALDALAARVLALEGTSPSTPAALPASSTGPSLEFPIPDRYELFPGHFRRGFDFAQAFTAGASALTRKSPALFPAIHTATVGDVGVALADAADHEGEVLANRINVGACTVVHLTDAHLVNRVAHGLVDGQIVRFVTTVTLPAPLVADTDYYVRDKTADTFKLALTLGGAAITFTADGAGVQTAKRAGAEILVPGGLGHAGFTLAPWGLIGSDGRQWYAVNRAAGKTSYFPADMERRFFTLAITPEMLRAGHRLTMQFGLIVALFNGTSSASIQLVIEVGTAPSQADPATTETNLQDISWEATPLLTRRLVVNELQVPRTFGCRITRDAEGEFSATGLSDGFWAAAAQAPTDATFVLGARLVDFDTQNSVANARGTLAFAFTGATAKIE